MELDDRILPAHIEETIRAIAELHARQASEATAFQRIIARTTAEIGRPRFLATITVAVVVWISMNLALARIATPLDPPPFSWLSGCVSLIALYVTILILSTQQRDDIIAGHREQLTLELAILSEQKAAKIISLLEDLRRDNPMIPNRIDAEAVAMSTPADPQIVLEAIKESAASAENGEPA
ncbi:MAG: DUF1003 domain-containing protein [Candidatus Velthaea sp.]